MDYSLEVIGIPVSDVDVAERQTTHRPIRRPGS